MTDARSIQALHAATCRGRQLPSRAITQRGRASLAGKLAGLALPAAQASNNTVVGLGEGGTPLTLPPHCRHRAHSGTQPCRKAVLSTEVGREPHTPLMCRAGPREPGQGGVGWGHPTARRGWLRGLGVQDVMAACGCSYCNLGIPGAAGEGSKATPTPAPRSPQPLHAPCQPPAPRRHLPSPCKPSPQPLAPSQDTCSPQPSPPPAASRPLRHPEPCADSSSPQPPSLGVGRGRKQDSRSRAAHPALRRIPGLVQPLGLRAPNAAPPAPLIPLTPAQTRGPRTPRIPPVPRSPPPLRSPPPRVPPRTPPVPARAAVAVPAWGAP